MRAAVRTRPKVTIVAKAEMRELSGAEMESARLTMAVVMELKGKCRWKSHPGTTCREGGSRNGLSRKQ